MIKIFSLIRMLGWKHFLWKVWLVGKKKAGIESWFSKSVSFDTIQVNSITVKEYLKGLEGDGYWSERHRNHICDKVRALGLPFAQYRSSAQDIMNQKIRYFSHELISLSELDFNYNPLEDIHVPAGRHSSQYFSFDPNIGDLKKVWELNRFQWANPLVMAYLLEEEEEEKRSYIRDYYEKAIVSWLSQCPHERSVAWACSQEISIRCLNWLWSIWLLEIKKENILTPLLNAIYLSAVHVFKQIDFARAQRNNHAITESVFLIFFSKTFPQLPGAEKYFHKGEQILIECLEDQFSDDGGYIQNSHTYHRFALQSLCAVYPLVHDPVLKKLMVQKMEASFQLLSAHVTNDTGEFPNFGPNDGAMLYNFGGSGYRDLRAILNTLSMVLYGENICDDPQVIVDSILLQSQNIVHNSTKRPDDADPGRSWYNFSESGITIFRQGFFKVFFRCIDLEERYPSSSDQLHVDLWYKGKNILTDTGTWEYYSSKHPAHLNLMLSTRAHNTIMVDGKDQMEKGPRFTFLSKANGKIGLLDTDRLIVEGEHDGFRNQVHPDCIHRRKVQLDIHKLTVTDTVENARKEVTLFWHISDQEFEWVNQNILILKDSRLKITFNCKWPFELKLKSFPRSLYYGMAIESPMISITVPATYGIVMIETMVEVIN